MTADLILFALSLFFCRWMLIDLCAPVRQKSVPAERSGPPDFATLLLFLFNLFAFLWLAWKSGMLAR